MNDFTKEELILAYDLIDACIELAREPDFVYDLRDKIQSMIDNYCDHEFELWISPHGNVVRCAKCNKSIP